MFSIKKNLLLGSLFICTVLCAQEKLEREYRIKRNKVPKKAIVFVKSLQLNNKIKWFGEESLHGSSIEAKTKVGKTKYSIEFDTLGNLQDVEIQIAKKQIPTRTLEKIQEKLGTDFTKFKFIKIQKQFSGKSEHVRSCILRKQYTEVTIKYEIVLKGTLQKKKGLYEYTFTDKGIYEKRERIIFKNSDNLEY